MFVTKFLAVEFEALYTTVCASQEFCHFNSALGVAKTVVENEYIEPQTL